MSHDLFDCAGEREGQALIRSQSCNDPTTGVIGRELRLGSELHRSFEVYDMLREDSNFHVLKHRSAPRETYGITKMNGVMEST